MLAWSKIELVERFYVQVDRRFQDESITSTKSNLNTTIMFCNATRLASRRIAASSIRSTGVRCLSGSTKAAPTSKNAMPFILAGGLAAVGLTQYNNDSATTKCLLGKSKKVEEAVKAVEDKFAAYWPRNIMVSDCEL